MNRLVGHRGLARVSKTPGRTQQINFFLVDERLTLVDLPGYGFAHVPTAIRWRWKRLVETYLTRRKNLRAVVLIIDLRRGMESEDGQLCSYLAALRIPVILVATKSDKLAYGERQRRAQALDEAKVSEVAVPLLCSGCTGEGLQQLWRQIEACAGEAGCSRGNAHARDKI
jgi:GTP-binding protein